MFKTILIILVMLGMAVFAGLMLAIQLIHPADAHWDDDTWVQSQRTVKQNWESPLELECFLALQESKPVVIVLAADGSGGDLEGWCEDRAFDLRDRAESWGRYLDVEILTPVEYQQHYGKRLPPNTYHAINKAVIGNEWWYADREEGKVWYSGINLD